jgi:hypothetical protein
MDAISFVLGVKTGVLRSSTIKDLVYRDIAMFEGDREGQEAELENQEYRNVNNPTRASVTAVYETNQGETIRFTRTYVSIR